MNPLHTTGQMHSTPRRVTTVIEGYPFELQLRSLGYKKIIFPLLLDFCQQRGQQVSKPIFCIGRTSTSQPFIDALGYNGFDVITRDSKRYPQKCSRCRKELGSCPHCNEPLDKLKADFDADIGFQIGRHVYGKQTNYLLIFAADGDFVNNLATIKKERNTEIEIVALSPNYQGPMMNCKTNPKLYELANHKTPLETVANQFSKK